MCLQDTLRECPPGDSDSCNSSLQIISPMYFVSFVLTAQFVLINVVVAVLMKHLDDSNKEAQEDAEMEAEMELELAQGALCCMGRVDRITAADGGEKAEGGRKHTATIHTHVKQSDDTQETHHQRKVTSPAQVRLTHSSRTPPVFMNESHVCLLHSDSSHRLSHDIYNLCLCVNR